MDSDLEPSLSAPGLSVTPARQDPGDPEPSTDPQQVPASAAASAAIAAAMTVKVTRGHSCVLCQQRKVRCDRAKPCSNCVRAKAECRVVPPQPPRRRAAAKKRQVLLGERELIERLRRYEALLAEKGVEVDAIANDVRVLPDDGGRDRESGRRRDEVAELEDEMVGLKTSASAVGDAPEGSVDSAR